MNEKKVQLLNYQLILTGLFIITLIVSIILTYDEKRDILNKQKLFSDTFEDYLNLFNRIAGVLIIVAFLYINYQDYQLNKGIKRNIEPFKHQIASTIFNLISAAIALYVVIENWNESPNISDVENPIV